MHKFNDFLTKQNYFRLKTEEGSSHSLNWISSAYKKYSVMLYTCSRNSGTETDIEHFHSRDYWPYWFTETKESICIKIEFNSQRFSLGHQHGLRDVMWKHSYDWITIKWRISIKKQTKSLRDQTNLTFLKSTFDQTFASASRASSITHDQSIDSV